MPFNPRIVIGLLLIVLAIAALLHLADVLILVALGILIIGVAWLANW